MEGKFQAFQPKAPGKDEQVECDALVFVSLRNQFYYTLGIRATKLKEAQPITLDSQSIMNVRGDVNFTFNLSERPHLKIQILATDPSFGIHIIDLNSGCNHLIEL